MNEAKYQRLADRENPPTEKEILSAIGLPLNKLYEGIKAFLASNYNFEPELTFGGIKHGWGYKYRRKGKTLCVLLPESQAFTVLVILGSKEVAGFSDNRFGYNKNTQELFDTTRKFHDGMWLHK